MTSAIRSNLAFVIAILAVAASATAQDVVLAPGQARAIARDAYVFTYPLVMSHRTMYMQAIKGDARLGKWLHLGLSSPAEIDIFSRDERDFSGGPALRAVWANNLEGAIILLNRGARTNIRRKDGLRGYETTLAENKTQIVEHLESKGLTSKHYDRNAKTRYSENDVIAFLYNWFAGFDHQADISIFKTHLNPEKIDMYFPDFPIKSLEDFERWYKNVIDNIQWNSHTISNVKVSGDEINGFSVSFDINWKAKTYNGESYDMNIHQDWIVKVDNNRKFVIETHRARVIDKQ